MTLPTTSTGTQQIVNIRLEPTRRTSDCVVLKIPEALEKEVDTTYEAVLRRLWILGGVSSSTALGLTVASSIDLGIDNRVFHALGYTCLGFTLGCLSVIYISKIFLKKIREIHSSVNSVKSLMETTSFIPIPRKRSLSSPDLSSPHSGLPPLSSDTYLLPVASHLISPHLLPVVPLLPVALPVSRRRNSNT